MVGKKKQEAQKKLVTSGKERAHSNPTLSFSFSFSTSTTTTTTKH
jgi:hypothetical protein